MQDWLAFGFQNADKHVVESFGLVVVAAFILGELRDNLPFYRLFCARNVYCMLSNIWYY